MRTTNAPSNATLTASITRKAGTQTFYTIHLLVGWEKIEDAYRTYANFHWVDDSPDALVITRDESLIFIEPQKSLLDGYYCRESLPATDPHEELLIDLIRRNDA